MNSKLALKGGPLGQMDTDTGTETDATLSGELKWGCKKCPKSLDLLPGPNPAHHANDWN